MKRRQRDYNCRDTLGNGPALHETNRLALQSGDDADSYPRKKSAMATRLDDKNYSPSVIRAP